MNRFREVFPTSPVLLPVIHVIDTDQMLRNLEIVFAHGADGVFLIGHGMATTDLLVHYRKARGRWRDRWIGVNCLDLRAQEVFGELPPDVSGVWTDNAQIRSDAEPQHEAKRINEIRRIYHRGLYFGGVAFKYQAPVPARHLRQVVQYATRHMDVVTTSGPGTNQPAASNKLAAIREAIGDFPIGLASGVTPQNVHNYRGNVDAFLVASSFTDAGTELIRTDDFRALVEAVRTL